MQSRLAVVLLLILSHPALAGAGETAPVVVRGTEGLERVSFRALNRSPTAIECEASIAHWYSAIIGAAEPGKSVTAELWSDPTNGAVYLLNEKTDRMPVQALFCGLSGKAASTRSDVVLARRAGRAEPPVSLACDTSPSTPALLCRRGDGG